MDAPPPSSECLLTLAREVGSIAVADEAHAASNGAAELGGGSKAGAGGRLEGSTTRPPPPPSSTLALLPRNLKYISVDCLS